jgi:hypothetical protein
MCTWVALRSHSSGIAQHVQDTYGRRWHEQDSLVCKLWKTACEHIEWILVHMSLKSLFRQLAPDIVNSCQESQTMFAMCCPQMAWRPLDGRPIWRCDGGLGLYWMLELLRPALCLDKLRMHTATMCAVLCSCLLTLYGLPAWSRRLTQTPPLPLARCRAIFSS